MLSKRIKLVPGVRFEEDSGILVIKNNSTGALMVTNDTGRLIIEKYNGQKIDDIIMQMQEKFTDVEPSQLESDVLEFLNECQRKGVLNIE